MELPQLRPLVLPHSAVDTERRLRALRADLLNTEGRPLGDESDNYDDDYDDDTEEYEENGEDTEGEEGDAHSSRDPGRLWR